jgi:two-component system phosphate regulon sensor histidine kinase PhoR
VKNPTPKKIAFFAAFVLSIILFCTVFLIDMAFTKSFYLIKELTSFALCFLISYILFYYTFEIFIYNKIKLIYKTIYNSKTSKDALPKSGFLSSHIIDEVNQEVLDWANDKKEEIEQLKRLEEFRKEFLGNVSHELKTPIFNIQGYIHTLLDGGIDDEHINILYLEKASRSVDRLCSIVDDLESISKFEGGELILEVRSFDLNELVKDVFDSLEMQSKEKNITFGYADGSDRSVFVFADKERIRQVLVNLIVNSIKYGKPNSKTKIGFYDMDPNILVEISDNGIGIEEKNLVRLFERFYRVDKSRSREQGGTGLGLSIVKHIIEAHNQTINVRSTIGVGSTFGFTLKKGRH